MLPPAMIPEALRLYRARVPVKEIHARLWPGGNPTVSWSLLDQALRALDAAEQVAEPDDSLPDGLETAAQQLDDARAQVVAELNAEPSNAILHGVLVRSVGERRKLEEFRLALQNHRAAQDAARRAREAALGWPGSGGDA